MHASQGHGGDTVVSLSRAALRQAVTGIFAMLDRSTQRMIAADFAWRPSDVEGWLDRRSIAELSGLVDHELDLVNLQRYAHLTEEAA